MIVAIKPGSMCFLGKTKKTTEFYLHVIPDKLLIAHESAVLFTPTEIYHYEYLDLGYSHFMPRWDTLPPCEEEMEPVKILKSNNYWGLRIDNCQVLVAQNSDVFQRAT